MEEPTSNAAWMCLNMDLTLIPATLHTYKTTSHQGLLLVSPLSFPLLPLTPSSPITSPWNRGGSVKRGERYDSRKVKEVILIFDMLHLPER